jgi:hypothetical protein
MHKDTERTQCVAWKDVGGRNGKPEEKLMHLDSCCDCCVETVLRSAAGKADERGLKAGYSCLGECDGAANSGARWSSRQFPSLTLPN